MAVVAACALCGWGGSQADGGERSLYLLCKTIDGRLLMKEPVQSGQRVAIVYNHSVVRVPVLEVFRVVGEGPLRLSELISRDPLLSYPGYEQYYETMSPWDGLSLEPFAAGLDMRDPDWFVVRGLDRARVMPISVGGEFVDHRLLVNGKVINLRELVGSGVVVTLSVGTEEQGGGRR